MHRISRFLSVCALMCFVGFFFAGCARSSVQVGRQISADRVAEIENGVTTMAKIEADFGKPTMPPSRLPNGETMYVYQSTRSEGGAPHSWKAGTPLIGGFLPQEYHNTTNRQGLQVIFDANGIVKDHHFTEDTTKDVTRRSLFGGVQQQVSTQ